MTPVKQRDRQAVINALRAGVVPARGLEHLQVGRAAEVEAIAEDIRGVRGGGSSFRIIQGDYGSGKSFFLQVVRHSVQRAGCVTMHADVTQDSRLYGTDGRVRSLYSTLVASAGTKTQPEGGAMAEVLERLVNRCLDACRSSGRDPEDEIRDRLLDVRRFRGGHELSDVVLAYWAGVRRHDPERREAALRWLRGEYRTRTEARQALAIGGIIGDSDLFSTLRLLATLVTKAGYGGLFVCLDELGVLARLTQPTRLQNYEQLLTVLNAVHKGEADRLGVIVAGTPEFVTDPVRGLFSYGALQQRLSANQFRRDGLRDTASPVIELEPLSPSDLWVLLENVHRVYCSNGHRDPLPDLEAGLRAFLDRAANQLGGLAQVTPREATRSWLQFLDILDQNRREDMYAILGGVTVRTDEPGPAPQGADDAVAEFPRTEPAPAAPEAPIFRQPVDGGESLAGFIL